MNSDESDPLIDGGSVGFPNATVLAVEPTVDGDVGEHRNELLPSKASHGAKMDATLWHGWHVKIDRNSCCGNLVVVMCGWN
jgi:hypothetical protein